MITFSWRVTLPMLRLIHPEPNSRPQSLIGRSEVEVDVEIESARWSETHFGILAIAGSAAIFVTSTLPTVRLSSLAWSHDTPENRYNPKTHFPRCDLVSLCGAPWAWNKSGIAVVQPPSDVQPSSASMAVCPLLGGQPSPA